MPHGWVRLMERLWQEGAEAAGVGMLCASIGDGTRRTGFMSRSVRSGIVSIMNDGRVLDGLEGSLEFVTLARVKKTIADVGRP